MRWSGGTSSKQGHSLKYSEAAIQSCLTMKSLINLLLRQAIGVTQRLRRLAGLDWRIPDFSTVSRDHKHPVVKIEARPTSSGLHLPIDGAGIEMLGEGEWKTKKRRPDCRPQ